MENYIRRHSEWNESQRKYRTTIRFDRMNIPASDIDCYAGQIGKFHIFIETSSSSAVPYKECQHKIFKWIIKDLKSPAIYLACYFSNTEIGGDSFISESTVYDLFSNRSCPLTERLILDPSEDRSVNKVIDLWLSEIN